MVLLVNICFIICLLELIVTEIETFGIVAIISSKPNITYEYKKGVRGEKSLHQCARYEACNVVHDRFWMPILTERLCQCTDGKECPWQWTDYDSKEKSFDYYSIPLNNRSLLKLCDPKNELRTCYHKQTAVIMHGESNTNNTFLIPHNVNVRCICPNSHYWKLTKFTYRKNSVKQIFKCVKKRKCESYDFCGHIRSDLYSTYYRCTCPIGHLCVFKNKKLENVQELLYSGPAYKAYCLPF